MPYGRDAYLYDIAPQLGSRCSLRLDGEHMYSKLDIATGAKFDDVIAWHSLVGMINGGAPVELPYGCILPKKIENLLCPGRHLSAAADTVADGKNGFVVRAEVGELEQAIRWMADNAMVKELSQAAYAGFDEEGNRE